MSRPFLWPNWMLVLWGSMVLVNVWYLTSNDDSIATPIAVILIIAFSSFILVEVIGRWRRQKAQTKSTGT